jgi:hypothetical protein
VSGEPTDAGVDRRVVEAVAGEAVLAEGVVAEGPPGSGAVAGVDIPEASVRTVPLRNDPRGLVARSVLTLAELPADLPAHALVGGLAVMVRLSESHRVTTDFDEVTAQREQAIDVLVAGGAQVRGSGVFLPESGLQLDLLDAAMGLDELAAIEPVDDLEREAVQLALANRYALESAAPTDIVVLAGARAPDAAEDAGDREDAGRDAGGRDGGAGEAGDPPVGPGAPELAVAARVRVPVALAGALVVMKVNSALSSTRARDKAAADAYDAYRLIRAWGSDVVLGDLADAPDALRATAVLQLRRLFRDDVDRTAYELQRASVPGVAALPTEQLATVAVIADLLER